MPLRGEPDAGSGSEPADVHPGVAQEEAEPLRGEPDAGSGSEPADAHSRRADRDFDKPEARDRILQQLMDLLPAQFERVVFEVEIPRAHLSSRSAPQATRAIEVIRWAEGYGALDRLGAAIAHAMGAVNKRQVLDALLRLTLAQFEEVLFRVGIPQGQAPSAVLPQVERAIVVIDWAETQSRLEQLASAIAQITERAQEERRLQEKIESSAVAYVESTVFDLRKRMERDRLLAYICYLIGLASFVAGVWFAYDRFRVQPSVADYVELLRLLATGVLVVGMLLGTTKYSFVIGRSFMEQSLRGMDRMHAIRFGIFSLKAVGDRFDWTQLKEAFQHWNIDKAGVQSPQSQTAEFDPRFIEQSTELIKALASLKPGK